MNIYTGVGSRSTPKEVLSTMTNISCHLAQRFFLRSGDAKGADAAFVDGVLRHINAHHKKPIYSIPSHVVCYTAYTESLYEEEAIDIAASFHPAWNRMSPFAKKLHTRNVYQVLGTSLDTPSQFVICWTPDGCEDHYSRSIATGGTGTAISVASSRGIPIFNLANALYEPGSKAPALMRLCEKLVEISAACRANKCEGKGVTS